LKWVENVAIHAAFGASGPPYVENEPKGVKNDMHALRPWRLFTFRASGEKKQQFDGTGQICG
jgi:hypothetical protein